jgi:hypothetical protein
MSGSGNSDYMPIINNPIDNDNCSRLVIKTQLASPKVEVVSNLRKGDLLSITTASDQGPIQAFDSNQKLAGNIVSREQARLLNCINKGTNYKGEVISIDEGQCIIQIFAI